MARLLLDTHVFLWWRGKDRRLTRDARSAIAHADLVFVSVASAWEVAIKVALGRLRIPEAMENGVRDSDFLTLDVGFSHAERAGALPAHHADPFDRMLVAQAQEEGLTLVSHDRAIEAYDVEVLWT